MATNPQASQVFMPGKPFSHNERDWAAEIGMLPWDSHIVFTKESLIRFLKTLEVEVGTSMSEVRKLPKYAQFGSLKESTASASKPAPSVEAPLPTPPRSTPSSAVSKAHSPPPPSSATATDATPPVVVTASGEAFRPTRKVRELPGGGSAQIASLFGDADEDEADQQPIVPAASSKKPHTAQEDVSPLREKSILHQQADPKPAVDGEAKAGSQNVVVMPDGSTFVPSRKVREPVGGFSSMAALLSGE